MAGIVKKSKVAGKPKRTREHHIADLSANYVEKVVLDEGHTVEGFRHDYGYDLSLYTYNYAPGSSEGEYENDSVKIQLKATDAIAFRHKGKNVSFQVDMSHLLLWGEETMPVILVVFDAKNQVAYWLHMQPYIKGMKPKGSNSRAVLIPTVNVVNAMAVRHWRHLKLDRQTAIKGAGI